jgi:hypothetical protein
MTEIADAVLAGTVASMVGGGGMVAVRADSVDADPADVAAWLDEVGGYVKDVGVTTQSRSLRPGCLVAAEPPPPVRFYFVPRSRFPS